MDYRPPQSRLWADARRLLVAVVCVGGLGTAFVTHAQQTTGVSGVAAFKKLSLAQLMDVEVTSVSRRVEKLSDTASAIQVVSGDTVRRSGAQRIPSALRLFSNLSVAQV